MVVDKRIYTEYWQDRSEQGDKLELPRKPQRREDWWPFCYSVPRSPKCEILEPLQQHMHYYRNRWDLISSVLSERNMPMMTSPGHGCIFISKYNRGQNPSTHIQPLHKFWNKIQVIRMMAIKRLRIIIIIQYGLQATDIWETTNEMAI